MKFTIEGLDPDLKVLEGNVSRTVLQFYGGAGSIALCIFLLDAG